MRVPKETVHTWREREREKEEREQREKERKGFQDVFDMKYTMPLHI